MKERRGELSLSEWTAPVENLSHIRFKHLSCYTQTVINSSGNKKCRNISKKSSKIISVGEGDYHDNVHTAVSNGVSQSC